MALTWEIQDVKQLKGPVFNVIAQELLDGTHTGRTITVRHNKNLTPEDFEAKFKERVAALDPPSEEVTLKTVLVAANLDLTATPKGE